MKSSFVFVAAGLALATLGFGSPSPAPAVFTVTITISPTVATTGVQATFTAVALGGNGGLTYQWDFGDGVANATSWDPSFVTVNHTYATPGHRTVRVNVEDADHNTIFATAPLLVHDPVPAVKPTNSSTIIHDPATDRIWCVNADQDTVSAVNASTNAFILETSVGKNPRTLARAGDGTIWVVSQQHPSISVLDPMTGALRHVVPLPHGSLPYGIAMTPDGSAAYVTFQGLGGVTKISTSSRQVLATASNPPSARGVSVTSDGRVFVTRFISPQADPLLAYNSAQFLTENRGEVLEFTSGLGVVRTIKLVLDPGPGNGTGPAGAGDPDFGGGLAPSAVGSRGVPNYLTSMVISPDGKRAWVPSKKDNVQRGKESTRRDGLTPTSESTYRAIVSSIDLTSTSKTVDELAERFDVDNSEMPQAACMSPLGDYLFIALQGNNRVQVRDAYDRTILVNGLGDNTGLAAKDGLSPQGLVMHPTNKKLFVHNYMGRTITIFDASAVLASNGTPSSLAPLPPPAPVVNPVVVVPVVQGADLLGATVLQGKQVFYNANDFRMSRLGYISCAGCHLDGGSDMRVFDFTNRGEGFRNTVVLQGRAGTGMGNVHWSANFNEIQDFDNDVFKAFHDGPPLFPTAPVPASFTGNPGSPNAPLAANNGGRDADLDALAAYVTSLNKVSRSPFRQADGRLTSLAADGEALFKTLDCQKCHKGRNFTDSTVGTVVATDPFAPAPGEIVLHDVGTIKGTSGQRLGGGVGSLSGIDTPTLKGIWQSAPYLHDGSAATLRDVFDVDETTVPPNKHVGAPLSSAEKDALVQYMLEIDEVDAPPVPKTQVNTVTLGAVATNRPYSLGVASVGALAFVDRSYKLATVPAPLGGKILLRTAEDDKNDASNSLVTLTLTGAADVYVFLDNRAGTNKPSWLDATWTASAGQNLFLSHVTPVANDLSMLAFKKSFAGPFPVTVTLGGNAAGGQTGALRNFFAIIDQPAAVFEEGPLSSLEFVHDRDADGDGLHDEYEAVSSLDPWKPNGGAGTIPDEDKLVAAGGPTRFADQAAFESPAPSPSGGGSSGCGLSGLEPMLLLGLALLARRRSR